MDPLATAYNFPVIILVGSGLAARRPEEQVGLAPTS